MNRSIFIRLFATFVALALIVNIAVVFLSGAIHGNDYVEQLISAVTQKTMDVRYALKEASMGIEGVQSLLSGGNISAEFVLSYFEIENNDTLRKAVSQEEFKAGLNSQGYTVKRDGSVVYGAFAYAGGAVYVYSDITGQLKSIRTMLQRTLLLAMLFTMLAFAVGSRFVSRPLSSMIMATKRVASGDFDVELRFKGRGELGNFVRNFNKMVQELRKLDSLRSDFVSSVSHEIKTPITAVQGYAQLLKNSELSNEQRSEYLDIIIAETARLSSLSTNLLQLSRIENKAMSRDLEFARLRLDELVRKSVVLILPQTEKKEIELDIELEKVHVIAQEQLMQQLIINLLDNAVKYTPRGGKVSVELVLEGAEAVLTVRDSGIGISPQDVGKVFNKFFMVDKSRSDRGSGLGLALVDSVARLHGGNVEVTSSRGVGSAFITRLPKATP